MSKETAHQLGTPLSSLMAWIEILRLKQVDEDTLSEIAKDLKRLETITERFSKIGSNPVLDHGNIVQVLYDSVEYMEKRSPSKVQFNIILPNEFDAGYQVQLNIPLFEWVIENLIRNAIDAMEGEGKIDIELSEKTGYLSIDVSDTGKGIPKSKLKTVFQPGYTSKRRGWGLGLSLTKRIIENYHKGKIFVKKSELGKGTTFRIMLKKTAMV
jgi:signal transduction histidine kinase